MGFRYQVYVKLVAMFLTSTLCGCEQLSSFYSNKKSNASTNGEEVPTEDAGNGATSALVRSDSSGTQKVIAREGNGIDGVMIAVPPGSISIDSKFLIEKTDDFATTELANALGLNAAIRNSGQAVKFSSDPKLEASNPMTITIPGPNDTSLTSLFLDSSDRWVLLYESLHLDGGETLKTGVVTRADFEVSGGKIIYKTKNFGRYQAAIVSEEVSSSVEKSSSIIDLLAAVDTSNSSSGSGGTEPAQNQVAAISASVTPGEFANAQSVGLSTTSDGAVIYYTTDGSTPSTSSLVYSSAISVNSTLTIKAIGVKSGYTDSNLFSGVYTINGQAAIPVASATTGKFLDSFTLTLSSATSGASIYYTTDGTVPTTSSSLYSSGISISFTSTVKAIAVKANFLDSPLMTHTYTANNVTALDIEAFPDTTNFATSGVTWTPKVKFSINTPDTVGLFSDNVTQIMSDTSISSGVNFLSANAVSSAGQTQSVYLKNSLPVFKSLGSYTTKLPPNFSMPGLNGSIYAIAKDTVSPGCTVAPGCVYLGGGFTVAGGIEAKSVVKIKSNGSLEALGSGVIGTVYALAVDSAGKLYVGGQYTIAGGTTMNNIAKWDPATSSWSALDTGLNNKVNSLAVDSSNNLYAGGIFQCEGGSTSIGNYPSNSCAGGASSTVLNRIAKWEFSSSNWSSLGSGMDNAVFTVAVNSADTLFAGGSFGLANNSLALYIAKWSGSWSGVSGGMNGDVHAIGFDSSGTLHVGGAFTVANFTTAHKIAKWDGTNWFNIGGAGFNNTILGLGFDSTNNLYVVGEFTCANGSTSSGTYPSNTCTGSGGTTVYNRIAKYNGSGWANLGAGMNLAVRAVALDSSNNLFAGGGFSLTSGVETAFVAKRNSGSTDWSQLGQGIQGYILSVARDSSGNIYVGGAFETIGGVVANNVAKLSASTGTWSALSGGTNGVVSVIKVDSSGNVYIGGNFTTAGGTTVNRIAKWSIGNSTWSGYGAGADGVVTGIAFDGTGNLYIGGSFSNVDGVSAANIAKWTQGSSTWSGLGVGANGAVNQLVSNTVGDIYVCGAFTSAGGLTVNRIAKLTTSTDTWSALADGFSAEVKAITVDSTGNLYAGGAFTASGATSISRIAKWDGGSWTALGSGADAEVSALAVDGMDNLFAGGTFVTVGGVTVNSIAKWNGTAWSALGTGIEGIVKSIVIDSNFRLYTGGIFSIAGGKIRPYIAKWYPFFNDWF